MKHVNGQHHRKCLIIKMDFHGNASSLQYGYLYSNEVIIGATYFLKGQQTCPKSIAGFKLLPQS